MNDLIGAFDDYFEIIPALTPELLEKIYRLRYQVYCEEIKLPDFESWRFPQGLETDEYDARSVHYLMRHRPTGKVAGTVRLVLPDPEDPSRPFPIEEFAASYFYPALIDPAQLPRQHTAEISRLILAREFRARKGERCSPYGLSHAINGDPGKVEPRQDRRHFPHPVLGLVVAIYRIAAACQITHLYAGMEPILNRLLAQFELDLIPIGPVIEYHGARRPYLGLVDEKFIRLYKRRREVWELLTDHGRMRPIP